MIKDGDFNALAKERTKQSLHSMAETYPEFRDGEWKYLFPPLLPNWRPLPGRITDNQQRWVQESVPNHWFALFEFESLYLNV